MPIKIGTAPDSWGVWFGKDPKQIPWHRCLDEIAAAGYEWTELGPYGYLPTDITTLRTELSKRQLKASASFVMRSLGDQAVWPILEKEVFGVGESLSALGAKFLVLIDDTYTDQATGAPTGPVRLEQDGWKRLIETTHRVGRIAFERFGLTLIFHPHSETHVEYEDQIESFLEQTDPNLIFLCLDTGHHAYRGADPVEFMRRHHSRIPYLHLKSVDKEIQEKVEEQRISFAEAVGQGVFCEPSKGAVDFVAFRDVLREIDYSGFAIVEQDMYPVPFDKPLPIARRTRAYLRQVGIG